MNLCPKVRDATCVPTARIAKAGKFAINASRMSVEKFCFNQSLSPMYLATNETNLGLPSNFAL